MFTIEKASNDVKFLIIFFELLNNYLKWSRSRAKVTAPVPAKYPDSGSETLADSTVFFVLCAMILAGPCRALMRILY